MADTPLQEFLKVYAAFRGYEEHENELLNHRTGWLVTIQSVLIGTFGFSYQKYFEVMERVDARIGVGSTKEIGKELLTVKENYQFYLVGLSIVGLLIAILSYFSIITAIRAQDKVREKYIEHYGKDAIAHGLPSIAGGGDKFATVFGARFARWLPGLLMALWTFVLLYSLLKFTPGMTFR